MAKERDRMPMDLDEACALVQRHEPYGWIAAGIFDDYYDGAPLDLALVAAYMTEANAREIIDVQNVVEHLPGDIGMLFVLLHRGTR